MSVHALEQVAERQRPLAEGLVLLQDISQPRLVEEVEALHRSLGEGHAQAVEGLLSASAAPTHAQRLREEHARFLTSVEQLRWFLAVVQREDHGGHRQALGQYWKVLLEALGRHTAEELTLLELSTSGAAA